MSSEAKIIEGKHRKIVGESSGGFVIQPENLGRFAAKYVEY